jgi:hypothetical protein
MSQESLINDCVLGALLAMEQMTAPLVRDEAEASQFASALAAAGRAAIESYIIFSARQRARVNPSSN